MIPLGPGEIPSSTQEMTSRISSALGQITGAGPQAGPTVTAELDSPSQISNLTINITQKEAAAARAEKPASLTRLGEVRLENFQVVGDPALIHGAPVNVHVAAAHIPAVWSRDDRGNLWLVPQENSGNSEGAGASGNLEIAAKASDLEAALRVVVAGLADANGAKLKDLRLRVESAGERALVLAVDVAASKFMMTAKVRALAELSLDDNMNLHIRNVDLTGDGAAGAMVANLLADKIGQWRGRRIDLGQFVFAGAALRDVKLETGQQLRLSARFGQ